ncbi:HAD-IA family hydrolase [Bordetella holmesii]|uniref:phosphoglycolate phosphatase n=2 Tax=Bordetella holmesii TaxID=35814 RepID=A0A158M970_9BORD|nr:HAD-IA family hydrolase [Bordetella holmesii]AHV93153.1 phosphoglycolate phosphatase, bacterial [Bordetella holmesii ATCC 51541]AIT27116.1 phosphoglycolate phosphatase, bacterial [Bordetella holmesii 44057]EWM43752.1 phosphoglycolate phosphatase, bacterial [Bordetella holmesii 41130]EWM47700.1 phosphoglycolate phosphatase, bacterial [Bordetella holmesii 35009]EWM51870.1 phosphoglycolate phosphatase, bacterial [Bordetella holmesii 70147]
MSALILFDFDGTLADTAPDLAAAANRQRTRRGLQPLPYDVLRPVASQGARGLLRVALDLKPGDDDYEATRLQFIADYTEGSTEQSRLFPGIADLLGHIRAQGLAWGIVTNKVTHLTLPIVEHLGLMRDSAVLVCGDTTAHAKPHPLPLLHAAEQAGFPTHRCVYVGDDLRDIQSAHAAGMPAIAAAYGYVDAAEDIALWQAEARVDSPFALWDAIRPLLPRDPA